MSWVETGGFHPYPSGLTRWGRVMHICASKLAITDSENGLLPARHQAIIWTNTGMLLIRTLGTNFSEIWSEIYTFSFKKMHLKMSGKCRPSYLGFNVLIHRHGDNHKEQDTTKACAYFMGFMVSSIGILSWTCCLHYWPFVRRIHRPSMVSPHKGSITWKR